MAAPVQQILNIAQALGLRQVPTITQWNRLEGLPRTAKWERALRAEVRDALWMLTRQWQTGEFRGDDAGSPVSAKIHLETTRLDRYQPGDGPVQRFDGETPLEAQVERRPAALLLSGSPAALDLRLLMGRQWMKLLKKKGLGAFASGFLQKYAIAAPDPNAPADAVIAAHGESWSTFSAVAGRRMDGGALYLELTGPAAVPAWQAIPGLEAGTAANATVAALGTDFVAWFRRLVYQPPVEDAWQPDRLEYRFACSAPEPGGEKVLQAREYYQGHLDWYSLDVAAGSPTLADPGGAGAAVPGKDTQTLVPAPISFHGMPDTRWWAFEEGRTNFGDVAPGPEDLGTMLLMEFGLMYANDWFLFPYRMDVGSMAKVRGIAVTNVFGERTWIEPAGAGPDDAWQRWAMYLMSTEGTGNEPADTSLVLLPTVPSVQQGKPLEEVLMLRDEVANMVWGVEKTVPLATGQGKPGAEAARETRAYFERLLSTGAPMVVPGAPGAQVRYRVMNSVPENWIPFVPVHLPNDVRGMQLQRAAMPRFLEGGPKPPPRIRPRTSLLRAGLDAEPREAMFIHEEEVPRAGVRVTQAFQRTRWRDGRAWLWLGVRKQTGRGEGSSGLAFDQLVDLPPPPPAE
jgi:hypothetical protein